MKKRRAQVRTLAMVVVVVPVRVVVVVVVLVLVLAVVPMVPVVLLLTISPVRIVHGGLQGPEHRLLPLPVRGSGGEETLHL